MSLKLVALIIFVVGFTLLAGFLLYENSRRKKEAGVELSPKTVSAKYPEKSEQAERVASVHDFFKEDNEQITDISLTNDAAVNSDKTEAQGAPSISVSHETTVLPVQPSDALPEQASDGAGINPLANCPVYGFFASSAINLLYARLEDILSGDFRISPRIRVTDLLNTSGAAFEEKLSEMSFDFLLSDLETGAVRCVVMTEDTMKTSPLWQFITELLQEKNIPVYRHADSGGTTNDQLSEAIYNLIEEAGHD